MSQQKAAPADRNRRKVVVGRVTSDKMAKTIVVEVERLVQDPRFGKYLKRQTKCYAHDEKREAKEGDRVEIMETRPTSRLKRWRLVKVVEKGPEAPAVPAPAAGGKA